MKWHIDWKRRIYSKLKIVRHTKSCSPSHLIRLIFLSLFFSLSPAVSLNLVFFLSSTQIRLFRKDSWCISILRCEGNELCHSFIFLTNAKIWNFLLRSASLRWLESFRVSSCLFLVTLNFERIKAVFLICTWSCEYINCLQKYSRKCTLPSWIHQFLFSIYKTYERNFLTLFISNSVKVVRQPTYNWCSKYWNSKNIPL